ncbi:MAG: hypothetical protein JSV77_05195 [Dehalococcoidales bacterium]|nr:MAG: hypothetical protein JSV77_05195 [Dehalococcoidales bacterium]
MRIRLLLGTALLVVSLLVVGCNNISQAEYAAALAEANAAQAQVSSLERELSDVQSELDEAVDDLEAAQNALNEAQELLSPLESQITSLESQVASLQSEVSSLQSQVASLQSSLVWEQAKQAAVIDQMPEVPWTGAFNYVTPGLQAGQTFVPDYPVLVTVEVYIITASLGRGDDTLTMKILDDEGVELATISKDVLAGFNGWLRFDFEGGVDVTVNSTLTILIVDGGNTVFAWRYHGGNYYPSGSRIVSGVPADGDFLFRTYGLSTRE